MPLHPFRLLRPLLMVALLFAPVLPAAAAAGSPRQTVQTLDNTLLSVMKDAGKLGFAGRRDRLDPVIRAVFNLPLIARIVMGANWGRLNDAQRRELVATFSKLTVATYAARFDGYDGETFQISKVAPLQNSLMHVRSEIREKNGDSTRLDYVLRKDGDNWRIINVVADGVSDLSLKRADYASVMQRDGFTGLIAKLKAQIAEYASSGKGT